MARRAGLTLQWRFFAIGLVETGGCMRYSQITFGTFIRRENRFLAHVCIDGESVPCHIPNTSRLLELCVEGYPCALVEHHHPKRKTRFTLVMIKKGELWVQIDSQAPNQIVYEALCDDPSRLGLAQDTQFIREKTFQSSRFDLYYENATTKGFIEIKGVTLECGGMAYFPGAPTTRGVKHLETLEEARQQGYDAHIIFLVQLEHVKGMKPHAALDPKFAETLQRVHEKGVSVHVWQTVITPFVATDAKGERGFEIVLSPDPVPFFI